MADYPRSAHDITHLLIAWSAGDEAALEKLTPLIYGELHRLAHHYMTGEGHGHTLQTTALINEAYLRLIEGARVQFRDRTHFFALSAKLMRRILVDFGRSRRSQKRGGARPASPASPASPSSLEESAVVSPEASPDLIALDEALEKLAAIDPRKSQAVELRFFGGLTVEETAAVLKIAPSTVHSDFNLAKLWLLRELGRGNNR